MGKPTGFLDYQRQLAPEQPPLERIGHFGEFHSLLPGQIQQEQAGRCMDCGVPFCQAGTMLAGMACGCPLHNLIPEMNDLVWRGNWAEAYVRLSRTHCLPEFTSRVCPALCEAACTCGLQGDPVSTKENERQVIEYAFAHGLVDSGAPSVRTGKTVAVVGSGPAGLAAALLLNRRGHKVTVFEKSDRPGGLLRYGIPNMKLEKWVIDRRVQLMEQAGVEFRCGVEVGKDLPAAQLLADYDRVILALGAGRPRDIQVPGREAGNIRFAVDFLSQVTQALLDSDFAAPPYSLAKGKQVLVIGGGDTGNDCVGTAIRLGAAGVTQLEMMPQPPAVRAESNPWPQWPRVEKNDYGQQEAIAVFGSDPRLYQTTVKEFKKDKKGNVCGAVLITLQPQPGPGGRPVMQPVEGSEREIAADLVLIAAGFLGCETALPEALGTALTKRGNISTPEGSCRTTADRVFAAGDARRGQSLVVWAIAEGRATARDVDQYLTGYSSL